MNNISRTAANGIGFLGSIRAMDFYRKIPRDLTEPTLAGGTMSLLSTIIMGVLLLWQVMDYMKVDVISQVVIDRTEDADFRVNFNVTFPELACDQVSVDIMDAIGHRSMNLSEHGCEGSGKMGGWCYVINKYSTIEGHSLQLAGSQYARNDPKEDGRSVVGGYKRYMMNDFEGAKELDPQDPESYNTAREYGLDVDKVLSLIESVRQKQGEMPAAGSQEELREKEKLLKMAQNLHLWMETDDPIAKDVYGNRKASIELDSTTFYSFLESHKFVMVDFHAPWCPHCQHLDPTWQQFAFVINQHTYRRGAEINTRGHAAIATVNCVENNALCTRELIQGYPTIRVYRNGASGTVFTWEEHFDKKENKTYYFNPVTKVASWEKPMRMSVAHTEEYMGQRDVQSLIAFVDIALTESLQFEGYKVGANQLPVLDTIDIDGNGESDSRLVTKGCTVEGFVTMSRVPGSLKFRSVGKDLNMDPHRVNMTHTVNHLSFGNRLKPYELRTLLRQDLGSEGTTTTIPSVNWNYNKDFVSKLPLLCHEHYIKIVSTTFKYLSGQKLATYEYTINSNKLIEHTAANEQAVVPSTTFRFDLSPVQVILKEQRESIIRLLGQTCAIVGGVYTVAGLLEATVNGASYAFKRRQGKHM